MDAAEDGDLVLQRTTASSVSALLSLLTKALWKPPADGRGVRHVHRRVRNRDLDRIIALIEPFQEEPQLLDVHLKKILPPLATAYLGYLQRPITTVVKSGTVTLSNAVCRVITTFCKVRGEKVIIGFLNNEPRFLEPILDAFEEGSQPEGSSVGRVPEAQSTWEERYVLLLWLSHLMLAPFDLASISSKRPTRNHYEGVELPAGLPSVARRTISICALHLSSATKVRDAAAKLLVRLSLRPDMRAVGLLNSLIPWSLQLFTVPLKSNTSIHHYLGHLSFLNGLVALANSNEIGAFVPSIYDTCRIIAKEDALLFVRSSALAKKLITKSFRNIVLLCIQPTIGAIPSDFLELDSPLEDVIDYLLNVLSDRDTPVRYAASKSLSVIALKLDPQMAREVVGAVLGSLQQDVLWNGPSRNLTAVNPLLWHGLTLTLAHFLFRRTPSTAQLPDILSALLMALTFEQRSATGGSIGTNVRDAACFGIWSLSRRYTTQELLAVDTSSIRAATRHGRESSVVQMLAVELLVTACLDPAGNIRRGSSAALQELIGRHPDTVHEGIPLVQIVDYHAVGLRQRAMTEISFLAASLGKIYRDALFDGLFDWRGVGAPDVLSRNAAAEAMGRLSTLEVRFGVVMGMVNRVKQRLKTVAHRDVEERHGLMMSLASFIDHCEGSCRRSSLPSCHTEERSDKDLKQLVILWSVFDESFNITDRDLTSTALRPELTVVAVSTLIYHLAQIPSINMYSYLTGPSSPAEMQNILHLLSCCIARTEETTLQIAPDAATAFVQWFPPKERERVVEEWLSRVCHASARSAPRDAGYVLSLAKNYRLVCDEAAGQRIVDALTIRCTPEVDVDTRVNALRSLRIMARWTFGSGMEGCRAKIAAAVHAGLNDYTINERGDVGSLVRLEALDVLEEGWAWHSDWDDDSSTEAEERRLYCAVLRLSVEKLDRIRVRAAQRLTGLMCRANETMDPNHRRPFRNNEDNDSLVTSLKSAYSTALAYTPRPSSESETITPSPDTSSVSTYLYYRSLLQLLAPNILPCIRKAILEGYISSAGGGSESVVQASRTALADALAADALPTCGSTYRLVDVCHTFVDILRDNLSTDRIVLPLLEVLAFLFDALIIQRVAEEGTYFRWKTLLSLVQKAHFKSNSIPKLLAAVNVYRGLTEIEVVRGSALTKLASMLLHPFPKVRAAVADSLYTVTEDEALKPHDWSSDVKALKPVVEAFQKRYLEH